MDDLDVLLRATCMHVTLLIPCEHVHVQFLYTWLLPSLVHMFKRFLGSRVHPFLGFTCSLIWPLRVVIFLSFSHHCARQFDRHGSFSLLHIAWRINDMKRIRCTIFFRWIYNRFLSGWLSCDAHLFLLLTPYQSYWLTSITEEAPRLPRWAPIRFFSSSTSTALEHILFFLPNLSLMPDKLLSLFSS